MNSFADLSIKEIFSTFITLFAVIDILGSIPIILSLRQKGMEIKPVKATLSSTVMLLIFLFGGNLVLELFNVDIYSFAVAGSFILFIMALEMILDVEIFKNKAPSQEATMIPIVFPLVAGPASFTTLLSLCSMHSTINILIALALNLVWVYIVLSMTSRIERLLGKSGIYIARKFFGATAAPRLPYVRSQLGDLAKRVVRSQTTLTGAQAKLSLDIDRGGRNEPDRFTIVGLWGRFILKPQTDTYRALPELEDVTMHMAEAARIATVPHALIRFRDGELCYITRRVDRRDDGSKVPMEDMCQLTERLTEYKYKGSYEQIAKAIRRYSAAPQLDVVNFWEVVVFSWITGNADMHLKNFSLYNPDGAGYTLTPAYDMLSTHLAMPEDNEELALTLNGKKRKLRRDDFIKSITSSGVDAKVIDNMARRFGRALPQWFWLIDRSFLPEDMRRAYKSLILRRIIMLR